MIRFTILSYPDKDSGCLKLQKISVIDNFRKQTNKFQTGKTMKLDKYYLIYKEDVHT